MAVVRVVKTSNYTVMSNYHLRDMNLSLRTKGLLSQMLSLPPEWDYSVMGLTKINREGKDAIVACSQYRVGYYHCEELLETLVVLKKKDYTQYQKRLKKTCGFDLLILDDFLLHTLTDEREVKLLFEILKKRSEMKLSTFTCSQRDPQSWSAMIMNDEVSANAILKRATKHYTVVIKPKSAI